MNYKFSNVIIESMASLLPEESISSSEIENQLKSVYSKYKLSVGRLELMTGIKNRFIFQEGMRPSQKAIEVAQKVLEKSNLTIEKIDLLINASVCRDFLEPATAAFIHKALKLKKECGFMDISNACIGVIQAIFLASMLIESSQINAALIVSCENSRPLITQSIKELQNNPEKSLLKKLFSNFTIGSGAYGVIISHKNLGPQESGRLHVDGGVGLVDSESSDLCMGGGDIHGLFMQTQSELMLEKGINLAQNAWIKFCEHFNTDANFFDYIITHQVGDQHRNSLYKALNIPIEKDFSNYENLGNTGSVALPMALDMAFHKMQKNKQNYLALLAIGSGLSTIMMRLQWRP